MVVTRLGPELFYLVTNAACREKDCEYLSSQIEELKTSNNSITSTGIGGGIDWEVLNNWGLIALQGPRSAAILADMIDERSDEFDINSVFFGTCTFVTLRCPGLEISPKVLISRGGYTGEDGFEISIPPESTVAITKALLKMAGPDKLRFAGLGARDSLRLEAGMCLYGHDLDDTTTPVEAGLSWVVGKQRRVEGGFHGSETILRQLRPLKDGGSGVERRRVGLIVEGAPAREGAEIMDLENTDAVLGNITSGCPSPTLGKNIAMGYIKQGWHKAGTEVQVVVRGRKRKATVTKMPFVKSRYWKQPNVMAPG